MVRKVKSKDNAVNTGDRMNSEKILYCPWEFIIVLNVRGY